MADKPEELFRKALEASRVFTPSAPINSQDLFAGRNRQVSQVIDAINQRGQHAIIFGERGVGKTSLANVLPPWLESLGHRVLAPLVNCDSSDTFSTVWQKMFSRIYLPSEKRRPGFVSEGPSAFPGPERIQAQYSPDDVALTLQSLEQQVLLVLIFDEFDKLADPVARQLFADAVKTLSDYSVGPTLILVGVADTVDQLIEKHHSISRALIQIKTPRMSKKELHQIVEQGLARLEMSVDEDAKNFIAALSQGLPHYTHLLALHATRDALESGSTLIRLPNVRRAINKAIDEAQETIRSCYNRATDSARKDNLYADVLLACALAKKNDAGFFSAAAIRTELQTITGKPYQIPSFAQHVKSFCDTSRGPILQRTGTRGLYRFRFQDPLIQPFVVMRGLSVGRLTGEVITS